MLLGLDLGTTNVKALVADEDGLPFGHGSCPVRLHQIGNGGVEQDLEEIWQATLAAINQALKGVQPAKVRAIGVSSQGGALQLLDPQSRPLGRVISWLDQRGRPFDQRLTEELGKEWFWENIAHRRSGLAVGQLLRLRAETPAQLEPPNRIGFVGDAIVSRLCGCAAQDGTSAGLTLLYDPRSRTYSPRLLERLGLAATQLPALVSPPQSAGGLLSSVAAQTGLRPGIPVSPAVHDQYASALATGAVQPGILMVGTGTAWVLLGVSDKVPGPVHDGALVCHHIVDGLWGQIVSMVNGGSSFSWALQLTGQANLGPDAIDQLLETAGPGSGGLALWPFMTCSSPAGLPSDIRGRLSGLQLSHGAAHLVRAVVEGLACELNRHLGLLRDNGQTIDRIVLGGSAAASRVTPRILADVTGLPLRGFGDGEASVVGAVIVARHLLEPKVPVSELAAAMAGQSAEVLPGPDASLYQAQYHQYLRSLNLPVK